MLFIRRRLTWIALLWIAAQVSSLAAAPVALSCRLTVSVSVDDEDVCCEGLAPGQICPLHKHGNHRSHSAARHAAAERASTNSAAGDHACRMTSGCTPRPEGLEAVAISPGIIPTQLCTKDSHDSTGLSFTCDRPVSRSSPPISPPPRA